MNISQVGQHAVIRSWWVFKIAYGLLFVIAGADKFLNLVTFWPKYIAPFFLTLFSLSVEQVVMGAGIAEIILGVLILGLATRIGGYIAADGCFLLHLIWY